MPKLEDVVSQLQAVLPEYTDLFSESVDISTVANTAGSTFNIETATVHGKSTGDYVSVSGVLTNNQIITVTDQGDNVIKLTTLVSHDLTENFDLLTPANHPVQVFISGYSNLSDGLYALLEVIDGFNFTVSLNVVPSGTGFLNEDRFDSVNGRFQITVIDTTNFTINAPNSNFTSFFIASDSIIVSEVRITGTGDPSTFLKYYSDQTDPIANDANNLWGFVVNSDTNTSFSRKTDSDANQRIKKSNQLVYECVQSFFVYVVTPQNNRFGARFVSDLMVDIRKYLCKSLVGIAFPSGFDSDPLESLTTFLSDGFFSYVGAYYVHQFEFETTFIFNPRDAVDPRNTRAFRNFEVNIKLRFDDYTETKKQVKGNLP